jgi:hypothetical protein
MDNHPLLRRLGFPEVDREVREQALADPGPTWTEWFYSDFLKVWIPLGFIMVDTIIAASWLRPLNPIGLTFSLGIAFYLEFLAFRYLWYHPPERGRSIREPFRRTWWRPFPFGRWTLEGARARQGLDPFVDRETGPDPYEFL